MITAWPAPWALKTLVPKTPARSVLALEHRAGLLRRGVRIVEVVVGADDGDVGILVRHHLGEALLAALDRADVRVGRVDVDLALAADRLGEAAGRDAAALDVVRADVADREGHRAADVVAVAEEGVDGDHLDAGVDRGLQRPDHLVLLDRRGDDVVEVAARDQRVEDRRLRLDAPGRRDLRHHLEAEVLGRLVHPDLHHLVERVDHARQEADLDRVVLRRGARRQRSGHRRGQGAEQSFTRHRILPLCPSVRGGFSRPAVVVRPSISARPTAGNCRRGTGFPERFHLPRRHGPAHPVTVHRRPEEGRGRTRQGGRIMGRTGASVVALAAALSLVAQAGAAQMTALGEPEGAAQHRRLARLHRARRDRRRTSTG